MWFIGISITLTWYVSILVHCHITKACKKCTKKRGNSRQNRQKHQLEKSTPLPVVSRLISAMHSLSPFFSVSPFVLFVHNFINLRQDQSKYIDAWSLLYKYWSIVDKGDFSHGQDPGMTPGCSLLLLGGARLQGANRTSGGVATTILICTRRTHCIS